MAGSLPPSGVSLVAQGAGQFLSAMNSAATANTKFAQSATTGSAKASAAYAKLQASATASLNKIAGLTDKLSLQQRAYALMEAELAKTTAKYGENSTQAQRAQLALDRLGASIKTTERELSAEQSALDRTESEMRQATAATATLGTATQRAGGFFSGLGKTVSSAMQGITGAIRAGFAPIGGILSGVGRMFDQILIGALRRVGEMIVNVLGSAVRAVGRWLKESVGVAGDFEQTLNVLGAQSKATAAELDQVSIKAKALGADLSLPATSAQDAAEVMLELSKSGFSVQQSMDAAKGALLLATAAETDAATAAQVVAGAINAFELEASDATKVVDLLAGASLASQANMTDLAQGLQQGGSAFHMARQSIDDLATSLAVLTKNNLTGSDSGTALKNAFMRLMNPTKKAAELMADLGFSAYDANGKMKPLPQIIGELNKAIAGMTDQERDAKLGTIFLSDGLKAMVPLLNLGEDGFNALKGQITEAGQASNVAGAQMEGWNGAVASTKSQMETLQLIIGTLLKNALTPLLFKVADLASKFTTWADSFTSAQGGLARFKSALQGIITAFGLGSDGTALMGLAVDNLRKQIGPLAPLVAGVVTGFIQVQTVAGKVFSALQGISVAFQTGADAAGLMKLSIQNLLMAFGLTEQQATAVQGVLTSIAGVVQTFVAQIQTAFAQGGISGAIDLLVQKLSALSPTFAIVVGTVQAAIPVVQAIIDTFMRLADESGITTNDLIIGWQAAQEIVSGAVQAVLTTVQGVFGTIRAYIPAVMTAVRNAIGAELAIVAGFWQAHGAEITAFVQTTWAQISGIIQTATQLVLMIVTGATQLMADVINNHGTEIQLILSAAWSIISNIISAALTFIQGVLTSAVQIMQGDWQGAWQTIQQTCASITTNIGNIIVGALNFIAGFFGTSLDGIVKLWESNWRALEQITNLIISAVAAFIASKTMEMLSTINRVVGNIKAFWDSTFGGMRDTVESMMSAAVSIVQSKVDAIAGAFSGIKSAIDSVIGKVKDLISALANIHVPDILTPGSPTPFEIGLRGIDAAAKQVAATFQTQFSPSVASVPVLQRPDAAPAPASISNSRTYNMPVHTNQSPAVLSQSLALIEAITA